MSEGEVANRNLAAVVSPSKLPRKLGIQFPSAAASSHPSTHVPPEMARGAALVQGSSSHGRAPLAQALSPSVLPRRLGINLPSGVAISCAPRPGATTADPAASAAAGQGAQAPGGVPPSPMIDLDSIEVGFRGRQGSVAGFRQRAAEEGLP